MEKEDIENYSNQREDRFANPSAMSKWLKDSIWTEMARDFVMNACGTCVYYLGRPWYYTQIVDGNNFNNLWWASFVPLFCSRFPPQRGLGVDMMLKGWIGACLAIIMLFVTMAIGATNWGWIVLAIFLDGFATQLLHVRDRTWLAFNVFHLMVYWGSAVTSYYYHRSRLTSGEGDNVDWAYLTVLAYSYFVPISIGSAISIGCHLVFCPASATGALETTLEATGYELASIVRDFRSNLLRINNFQKKNCMRAISKDEALAPNDNRESDSMVNKDSDSTTLQTLIQATIDALQVQGNRISVKRSTYTKLVAHAYLETRWKFSNRGHQLEQLTSNQSRAIMAVNAFCGDVSFRLEKLLKQQQTKSEATETCKATSVASSFPPIPSVVEDLLRDVEECVNNYSRTHMTTSTTKTNITSDEESQMSLGEKDNIDMLSNMHSQSKEEKQKYGELVDELNLALQQYIDQCNLGEENIGSDSFLQRDISDQQKIPSDMDRLVVTVLYSLRNVVLSLSGNDTLFLRAATNNHVGEEKRGTRAKKSLCGHLFPDWAIFQDWKRHDPIGTLSGIFSWHGYTFRASIQQGSGMVLVTLLLVYLYGENAGGTSGSFAVNTYCSVLRQVFVGWATCRVLVRCGGFFIGWLVAGVVYVAVEAGKDETTNNKTLTSTFFVVHMILCLFMMSQKYRWFEAILGKERLRNTGEGDPHMYVGYSMLVAWHVITNGWYGQDPGKFYLFVVCILFTAFFLIFSLFHLLSKTLSLYLN